MTPEQFGFPTYTDRPDIMRRIQNLRAIADDPTVNNFARSICGEAASYGIYIDDLL